MTRILTLLALTAVSVAAAADKEPARAKPLGSWERKVGDAKATFEFTAEQLKCVVSSDGATVTVHADYGVTKDGTLFGIVTKVEKQGTNDGPEDGDLFRFRFSVDKDKLTLKDLKPASDEVKAVLEGTYQRTKKE